MPTQSPHKQPYRPSLGELELLDQYHADLKMHNPYNRYGSIGVPCPPQSEIYLNQERKTWRQMLDAHDKHESGLTQHWYREADQSQVEHDALAQKTRQDRKDSGAVPEIAQKDTYGDKGSDASKDSMSSRTSTVESFPGSAIYDSDEDQDTNDEKQRSRTHSPDLSPDLHFEIPTGMKKRSSTLPSDSSDTAAPKKDGVKGTPVQRRLRRRKGSVLPKVLPEEEEHELDELARLDRSRWTTSTGIRADVAWGVRDGKSA